ncbi:poly(3-hydroxybutyrate) depolymerase [Duganella sp. FT80W]|uniref:Poly(3-hydroxybutyrate) depolymerase n=1 Tax=Duganella guangzhouensis TaxID=2666084 RepID=A0A6I2L081_9BURK|nr:poly(3-hydroxybutyrate) depolymerase [Duganella guangzhouensis]MRW91180.1 poly(3-hydroxybutyrate) depolymerase [Duganella guangzhouensis]
MKRLICAATMICVAFAASLPASARTESLPALGARLDQTTVSGISSGGFMAAQLATVFSSRISGVGVVAAGPFACALTYAAIGTLDNATATCMTPFSAEVAASADRSWMLARAFADGGKIDGVDNLKRQRVYIFSGGKDDTVKTIVVDQVQAYYESAGAAPSQIKYVKVPDAGHAFITSDVHDQSCSATASPYINNCGFMQAHELLRHLYPDRTAPASSTPAGTLIRFNQKVFAQDFRASMDDDGWVYVPDACRNGGCAVHVAFHGCHQGASAIKDSFYAHVGYNEIADNNRLIVLYPQAHASEGVPFNPRGCWDFWGYSNGDHPADSFVTRNAPQMQAVMSMITRLGDKP